MENCVFENKFAVGLQDITNKNKYLDFYWTDKWEKAKITAIEKWQETQRHCIIFDYRMMAITYRTSEVEEHLNADRETKKRNRSSSKK